MSGAWSNPPRCQYRNRIIRAERTKVCTFQRIDGDVDFRTRGGHLFTDAKATADFFTDEQHRRFIAFAFANDDAAAHRD